MNLCCRSSAKPEFPDRNCGLICIPHPNPEQQNDDAPGRSVVGWGAGSADDAPDVLGCVMRSVYEVRATEAREIESTLVQGTARLCSPLFGRVCKAIWPTKTAECLASEVGCSVRAAAYEVSGERHPSAQSVLVVIQAIVPKYR